MASRPAADHRTEADLAPDFELPSVAGGAVALADILAVGSALLVFVGEECPTCALTLRRLAPLVDPLQGVGVHTVALFEDPLEVAARTARRAGYAGTVLAQPPPYDV